MILCISLQGVALFPHHHHAEIDTICFDVNHCMESHSDFKDHNGCSHKADCSNHDLQRHNHDSNSDDCYVSKIVVIKPSGESSKITYIASLDFDTNIPSLTPTIQCNSCCSGALSCDREQSDPFLESTIVKYIAKALPLRAPCVLS